VFPDPQRKVRPGLHYCGGDPSPVRAAVSAPIWSPRQLARKCWIICCIVTIAPRSLRPFPEGRRSHTRAERSLRSAAMRASSFSPNGPLAVCVLTDNNQDRRWDDDNARPSSLRGDRLADVRALQSARGRGRGASAEGAEAGATGRLVEELQRNAQRSPAAFSRAIGGRGFRIRDAGGRSCVSRKRRAFPRPARWGRSTWAALGAARDGRSSGPGPGSLSTRSRWRNSLRTTRTCPPS